MRETRSTQTQVRGGAFSSLRAAFALSVTTVATLLGLTGCGMVNHGNTSTSLVTDCVLAPDQGGTLHGRWAKPVVHLAFDQSSSWNSSELTAMMHAADTWNSFFASSMGYPAFDYGSYTNPRMSSAAKSGDICSTSILDANKNIVGNFVIYKDGVWPVGDSSSQIALTTTCPDTSSSASFLRFQSGYTEVNYQNFFVNGNPVPDLQSIILHELGHVMGLNHSCTIAAGGEQQPSPTCAGVTNSSYLKASMYPSFSFSSSGLGEIRQSLNPNDMGRMNCLYKYE